MMRKSVPLIFILLLIATSCKNYQTFKIEGKVPNLVFWGSKVYLVALDAPVTKNVDSTIVESGGNFYFEVKADSFSVKILRIQAKYPEIIEDLVVVPEPGSIKAVLDSRSNGKGTRLNNILQEWKERKHTFDSIQWSLYMQKNAEDLNQLVRDSLMNYSKMLDEANLSDIICMINENINNGIGLLFFKLYFDALPVSEKNSVMKLTGNRYFERDAELKRKIR